MTRMAPIATALAAAAALAATPLIAQQTTTHGTVFVSETKSRWMNEHQSPAFTGWMAGKTALRVDSVVTTPTGRHWYLFSGTGRLPNDFAVDASTDSAGRHLEVNGRFRQEPSTRAFGTIDSASMRRMRNSTMPMHGEVVVGTPAYRAWDLVPAAHPARWTAGARWVDTISLASEIDGFRQALHGVRTSVISGDTTVDGARFWTVRDSMWATLEERAPDYEETLSGYSMLDRTVSGAIRGQYLIAASAPLYRLRDDTAYLSGTVTLHLPDGRTFTTLTRFERTQHIIVYDSTGYAARVAADRAAAPEFSMFRLPQNPLEDRLGAGDQAAHDSLLEALAPVHDVEQRDAIERELAFYRPRQGPRDDLVALNFAAGDTLNRIVALYSNTSLAGPQYTAADLDFLAPFLRDPGRAMAFGASREDGYEKLRQNLLTNMPAATADTSKWGCTPAACRTIASWYDSEREPRLVKLGLLARFALDPARWRDTIVARTGAGDNFYSEAMRLIRGVPNRTGDPAYGLPVAGADPHAWLRWMIGPTPLPLDTMRRAPGQPPAIRFNELHRQIAAVALAMHRDLGLEWEKGLAAAQDDSSRYIYQVMLNGIGRWHPAEADVAAWLQSDNGVERARGQLALGSVLASAPVADDALTTSLMDRVLGNVIDGAIPWPSMTPQLQPRPVSALLDNAVQRNGGLAAQPAQTIYVYAPAIPDSLRALWGARVKWVTDTKWAPAKSDYPATLLTFRPALNRGQFASIGVRVSSWSNGPKGVRAGAGGYDFVLLRTATGWEIVSLTTMAI